MMLKVHHETTPHTTAPAAAEPTPAPMSAPSLGVPKAHADAVLAAELTRQNASAVPYGQSGNAQTIKQSDIAFHRACLQSALANGVSPSSSIRALQTLGVM
jgi:hypothetical protein